MKWNIFRYFLAIVFLWCTTYVTYISCRKEIALRKEKNKEPLSEESLTTLTEPITVVQKAETEPLVAKDKVPRAAGSAVFLGGQGRCRGCSPSRWPGPARLPVAPPVAPGPLWGR